MSNRAAVIRPVRVLSEPRSTLGVATRCVTVTSPSMMAPFAIAMVRAMMSAWMTAVAPTSNLFSTTNLPEMAARNHGSQGVDFALHRD